MHIAYNDPVLLICGGIVVFGAIFLIWAIGKLRQGSSPKADLELDDLGAETPPFGSAEDASFMNAPIVVEKPAAPKVAAPAPAANKEIADRLDSMAQRLSEMQSVLTKQAATASVVAPGAAASPTGQGFSPETIDKLMKIIGNVVQQVDILQKSIGITPKPASPAGPAAANPGAPAANPAPPKPMGSPMGSLSAVKPKQ